MRELIEASLQSNKLYGGPTLSTINPRVLEHYTSLIVEDVIAVIDKAIPPDNVNIADMCRNAIVERWNVSPTHIEIKEWINSFESTQ